MFILHLSIFQLSMLIALFALITTTAADNSISKNKGEMSGKDRKFRILVTHPQVPQEAIELLSRDCEVIVCQSLPLNRSEILEKAKGVHAFLWAGHEALNAEALDAAGPQLRAISTMSAGIDFVDVAEVKRRKIPLGHTPIVLNEAVADTAVGLLLAAARRFHEGRQKIETYVLI